MFAITADQVDSTHRADIASQTMAMLTGVLEEKLVRAVDRTAGDEIQLLVPDAASAAKAILLLTRNNQWSVGCGVGTVNTPLPANTREVMGAALISAREAVESAKKRETRCAIRSGSATAAARDAESIFDLLLHIRARRTAPGWELFDLLITGMTQSAAAERLAISPQAAGNRARAAMIRPELAAMPALERMLTAIDEASIQQDQAKGLSA